MRIRCQKMLHQNAQLLPSASTESLLQAVEMPGSLVKSGSSLVMAVFTIIVPYSVVSYVLCSLILMAKYLGLSMILSLIANWKGLKVQVQWSRFQDATLPE